MVDKKKTGKGRLDKYYYLAKEQGYRARSAFKLVQLNNKYHFLENARVLVDLCAAPGGWLQVASKYMPLSRHIIGVDLDAIKPIPGVKTFVGDITTDKCRSELKKELATWKADVFLHDGAPNVGSSWCKDAYNQAELVLMALKLACEFLVENGTFVTKVFRSKDYNSLLWVFNQLFKKVESTKPASSRDVSAEIFVVCSGYLDPKKTDPRLFDPKSVFEEVEAQDANVPANVFKPEKRSKQRNGYEDGVTIVFKSCTLAEFIESQESMQLLADRNQITFDDEESSKYVSLVPTDFGTVKFYLDDLKVLGKSEFKRILRWRMKVRKLAGLEQPKVTEQPEVKSENSGDEIEELEDKVDLLKRLEKKAKRKSLDRKNKERIRMQLGISHKGDAQDLGVEANLFDLRKAPDVIQENEIICESEEEEIQVESESEGEEKSYLEKYDQELEEQYQNEKSAKPFYSMPASDNELSEDDNDESDDEDHEFKENSLIVKDPFTERNSISSWFDRPEFQSESGSEEEEEELEFSKSKKRKAAAESTPVPAGKDPLKTLTAIQSALTIRDQGKEDLIDESFNRYSYGDEDDLPAWFVDEEREHSQPQKPITKEAVMLLKERMKSIAARPIKKVQEFMARQRARTQRKLESLKKKADLIADSEEMNDKQKLTTITKLMGKNAGVKRKKPALVIARGRNKGLKGRPKGVRGHYKMVDSRMKKELRAKQKAKK